MDVGGTTLILLSLALGMDLHEQMLNEHKTRRIHAMTEHTQADIPEVSSSLPYIEVGHDVHNTNNY